MEMLHLPLKWILFHLSDEAFLPFEAQETVKICQGQTFDVKTMKHIISVANYSITFDVLIDL